MSNIAGIDALLRAHHHFLLFAQCLRELSLRDRAAVEGCHLAGRVRAAEVIVDPEKRERQRDQREESWTNRFVFGDEIEHVSASCDVKKGELAFALRLVAEWFRVPNRDPGVRGRMVSYFHL
jgi:hypothetical protein